MYRGRAQLGDYIDLSLVTHGANSDVAAAPDAAPTFAVYNSSGTAIASAQKMPKQGSETGLFGLDYFLGTGYAAGAYAVYYEWQVSGVNYAELDIFEILAGGNAQGAITSLCWYDRPHAKYLLTVTEDGTTEKRRGPKL